MNRSIVIFVALAMLIAHSLAIRTNPMGDLAPPYDQAYVAYQMAHNLVFEGRWSWSPEVSGFESYDSPLWVLICAFAERLSFSINAFVRTVGVLTSAISLMFATRFRSERSASLITPMLLALSGAMAAATVNGRETALFTALVTGAFLAFEHRHDRSLGLFLMLCGWTRDEGWVLGVVFLLLRLADRKRELRAGTPTGSLRPFVIPLLGLVILTSLRWGLTGRLFSTWTLDMVDLRQGELRNGLAYVVDFFVSSASPLLVLYCVWYLLRRQLSRTGKRGLAVICAWCVMIMVQGGGAMPFSESMVPILPILLIAGQEGVIQALNSSRMAVRGLAIASFIVAVVASGLASIRATNIGMLPFEDIQRRWMQSSAAPRMGFKDQLGRIGLDEETGATQTLREIAIFMRDEVDPRRSVLSPWPGSLAYLSGLTVRDLAGRATPAAPSSAMHRSPFRPSVDVVAAIHEAPDYIVPHWNLEHGPKTPSELAQLWLTQLESANDSPERLNQIEEALAAYEWISIPLGSETRQEWATLLRKRALDLEPQLVAEVKDGGFHIELVHHGHTQLADLIITGVDPGGDSWFISPSGELVKGEWRAARVKLLITETGERTIQLMRGTLERVAAVGIEELTVMLLNPSTSEAQPWTQVATPLILKLP